jgi:DNA-binding transcriptional LysR family regulator
MRSGNAARVGVEGAEPMTLTQLRYLVAIADHGFNISRAAAALHTSQPGVSRQIRVLEEQLGSPILSRNRGRVLGMTAAGAQALAKARRILSEVDALRRMSRDMAGGEIGTLGVATQYSYAISIVPHAVAAMRERYPGVSVVVQQAAAAVGVEMVRYGDVDIAITIEPPPPGSGLAGLRLADIPLVLIVPRGHPLLKRSAIGLEDLLAHPFIGPVSSSSADWGVRRVFSSHGLELEPAISVMNAGVMQSYVAFGAGIAIVPASLPRQQGVRAIDVEHLFKPNSVTAIFDAHRQMAPYTYDFVSHLAPQWTKTEIDRALHEVRSHASSGPLRAAGKPSDR